MSSWDSFRAAFADPKAFTLALLVVLNGALAVLGVAAGFLLINPFSLVINFITLVACVCGLYGAWAKAHFALFVSMFVFGVLSLLNLVFLIVNVLTGDGVFSTVISGISIAVQILITIFSWILRDRKCKP